MAIDVLNENIRIKKRLDETVVHILNVRDHKLRNEHANHITKL
jgi:hypothetical protein